MKLGDSIVFTVGLGALLCLLAIPSGYVQANRLGVVLGSMDPCPRKNPFCSLKHLCGSLFLMWLKRYADLYENSSFLWSPNDSNVIGSTGSSDKRRMVSRIICFPLLSLMPISGSITFHGGRR